MHYKLKDPKFEGPARLILDGKYTTIPLNEGVFDSTQMKMIFEKAGVLSIWFDEVEEPWKIGDFIITDSDKYSSVGRIKIITEIKNGNLYFGRNSYWREVDTRRPTPEELEGENLVLLAYTPTITSLGVDYGCQHFSWSFLESLYDVLNRSTVHYSFKVEEIEISTKILDKLLSKKP